MSIPILITFAAYYIILLAIGFYFFGKSNQIEDYLLGGRRMGAWVTAISAQASDMSGWLLMGLPGAIYLGGVAGAWIAIGLFIGTALNWKFIASRLRTYTQQTNTITLPSFFEKRFADPTGLLRTVSAIIILIFFTTYSSSALVATGKLFESVFNMNYQIAVIIGGSIIIAYTFLGGFPAVCWTDLFQGTLMVIAIIAVPAVAFFHVGGISSIANAMSAKQISTSWIPPGNLPLIAILSASAWGLGYFGQPHILARFMSAKSLAKLKESMLIAMIWVFLSLGGAVIIGLIGIAMFDNLSGGEEEKVFIYMIKELLGPWLGGVMLAAILSAIMSTIDSQLLVSSSALTEDFYRKVIKRNVSEKEVITVGRICVMIISAIAMYMALSPNDTILGIVAYSWGGFGAAFGPVILFALFSKRTTWMSALAGMVAGTIALVLWKKLGPSDQMYEIVPGFAANCLTIIVINIFVTQENEQVINDFEHVTDTARLRVVKQAV